MNQCPIISITQFINPVGASDQNKYDGKAQEKDEELERRGRVARPLRVLPVLERELDG